MALKRFKILFLCLLFVLTSCEQVGNQGELKKVGLLVPDTINDQALGTKGYRGLLRIQDLYQVDVYYKESMNSQTVVERAVEEFSQKEVNLIFGHGHEFDEYFNIISQQYPNIHFVIFNGEAKNENVTSLNFESYAMGFFAGMVAGYMTKTNHIGILPAFEWQPEVKGFYEGAKFQNDQVQIEINYVHDFNNEERALQLLDKLIANDSDVIYPAGDNYSVPAIEKIKEKGLYSIGYVSDQSDLGNNTVLTSTIQHVDVLYEVVAEKFNEGKLKSGNLSYDFQDDIVSLGSFSPLVDQEFIVEINKAIKKYKETGKLPNQ